MHMQIELARLSCLRSFSNARVKNRAAMVCCERLLELSAVSPQERQEAEKMFKGKRGAQLAKDIAKRTKT